ncbi:unnamed protein product [Leuciscus chuanchicus]
MIQCLGKQYDSSVKDSGNLTNTKTQLNTWLKAIEHSQLLGRFKVWCFQYGIIPRLQWPFLLYDFPMSQVEGMERLCSKFLRKWLRVPPSFSAINLYSKTSKLPLPVSSVVEEFKATKARAVSTLLSSEDGKVRHASKTLIWSKADARARRGLVVQRVREAVEERQVKAIRLASQGRWTQWDQAQERPLSWKELWQTHQGKLIFFLRSALAEWQYRWRHDKVRMEIAKWVEQQRVEVDNKQAHPPEAITFVREGDKAQKTGTEAKNPPSILQQASDWELTIDLKRKLVFPQDVAVTSLRPDMVLLSRSTKTIIVVELTVPWEERLATSHQLKKAMYQDLVDEAVLKGWHATSHFTEVSCRGLPAKSVHYFLQRVGLEPKKLKKVTRDIAAAAESSSRWLWLKRAHKWNPSAGEG